MRSDAIQCCLFKVMDVRDDLESESGDGDLMRGHAESVTGGMRRVEATFCLARSRWPRAVSGEREGVGSENFWSEVRDGGEVAFFDGGEEGGDGGGAERVVGVGYELCVW